jgi:hypothetical protein
MTLRPEDVRIFHITHIENLSGILGAGGLRSDAVMARHNPAVIGYAHMKRRRLHEIRVPALHTNPSSFLVCVQMTSLCAGSDAARVDVTPEWPSCK